MTSTMVAIAPAQELASGVRAGEGAGLGEPLVSGPDLGGPGLRIHGFPMVEAERLLHSIGEIVRSGNPVAILTHRSPDLDAAGAALGMQALIKTISREVLGESIAVPIYFEGQTSLALREAGFSGQSVHELISSRPFLDDEVNILLVDAPDPNTRHVLDAVQSGRPITPDLVVDHHSQISPAVARFIYTAPDSPNSASGILLPAIQLYFQARGGMPRDAEWSKIFAVMCAGVAADNNILIDADVPGLGRSCKFEIFAKLRELSDPAALRKLAFIPGVERALAYSRQEAHQLIADGKSHTIVGPFSTGLFSIGELQSLTEERAVLGKTADHLREECGLDVVMTFARCAALPASGQAASLVISVRTDREKVDSGYLARKLFAPYGDGRSDAAGVQIPIADLARIMPEIRFSGSGALSRDELEQLACFIKEHLN